MPSVSFKFCTAKVAGEGEDADPILRVGPDLGLLGVFDGMGGAGGRVYDTPDGRHSGAYIASRFARNVVERLMLELIKPEWNLDGPATAAELHRLLASSLAARLDELKARNGSAIKLVKALPTTMTLAVLQRTDSRGHLRLPSVLGRRLPRLRGRPGGRAAPAHHRRPALGWGRDAQPHRRLGDEQLHLSRHRVPDNHRQVGSTPFLLLGATDGCFAYVRSPMHFEHLLLSTLQEARDAEAWRRALERR